MYTHTQLLTSPEDDRQQTGGTIHIIFALEASPEQNEDNMHLKEPLVSVWTCQRHCKEKTVRASGVYF